MTLGNSGETFITLIVVSDWDGVCGVPGIVKAAITDQSAHIHWNEENIGNLGKTSLKERLFKMFQYKRCRIKCKNQAFASNSTFTVPQFKVMGDSLTPQKIVIHPNKIYTKNTAMRNTRLSCFTDF